MKEILTEAFTKINWTHTLKAIARQSLADNPSVESIVWTTADNQRVSMGIADFAAINGAAAVRSNALHIKYNGYKERVNAAMNASEVRAVVWVD